MHRSPNNKTVFHHSFSVTHLHKVAFNAKMRTSGKEHELPFYNTQPDIQPLQLLEWSLLYLPAIENIPIHRKNDNTAVH